MGIYYFDIETHSLGENMRLTSLLVVLIGIGTGCTVGLVDETKPIEAIDTAVDSEDTDNEDTDDTEDSGPDIDENSENPWNGECGDNLDNDGDGKVDCNDPDCVAAPECNQAADGDTDGDGYRDDIDCDPYNPYVNPGASEVDNNGIDDDCDGVVDGGNGSGGNGSGGNGSGGNPQTGTVCNDTCTDGFGNILYGANDGTCQDGGFGDFISLGLGMSACAFGTDCSDCGVRVDADGDFHEDDPLGLGLALYSDCNDSDPTINSSAYDIPDDGIDQDCDGSDASSSGSGSTTPTSETDCTDGMDEDQDGSTDCDDSDCASDPACQSSSGGCSSSEVIDCNGNCAPNYWVGDGSCDDGAYLYSGNYINLDCAQHNYDDGDCATSSGGGSTGGGSSSNCSSSQIEDCNGLCIPASFLGDGICDHNPNPGATSTFGAYSLMCSAMNWDDGDCPDNGACYSGEIIDCDGNCTSESTLGTGTCDPEFDCLTWYYDNNDC